MDSEQFQTYEYADTELFCEREERVQMKKRLLCIMLSVFMIWNPALTALASGGMVSDVERSMEAQDILDAIGDMEGISEIIIEETSGDFEESEVTDDSEAAVGEVPEETEIPETA